MFQKLAKSDFFISLSASAIASYIRLVMRTGRIVGEPEKFEEFLLANHPIIVSVWHGEFMLVAPIKPAQTPAAVVAARHGDAEIIGRAMERFGVTLIRGAAAGGRKRDRGGAAALRASINALRKGTSIVMTLDAPPGRPRQVGMGTIAMARLSGRPIVPTSVASSRYKALNTWSRFTINLPFSKIAIVLADPIYVPREADEAACLAAREKVQFEMDRVTARAYELAGVNADRATPLADAGPAKPGLALNGYRLATMAAKPIAPLILSHRRKKDKEDPTRLSERYGFAGVDRPAGKLIWFHAASVGETNAVLSLINRLAAQRGDITILLTTGTVTSARLAAGRLPARAIHQFVPLDSPSYVRRFLDYWKPSLALFVESEIWPNLILETAAQGVTLILLNGRMSKTSFRKWRLRPRFSRPLFSRFSLVLAQNEALARRFRRLGAANAIAVGNLKIDAPPPPFDAGELKRLEEAVGGRRILLAASTHPGEDEAIVRAHKYLAAKRSDILTIIVPRHPYRAGTIAAHIADQGLKSALRSTDKGPSRDTDIYIADTIGELGLFYCLAEAAFIGGSLVEHGGQNPVEAIKLNAAVITGPHWYNFRDLYNGLLKKNGVLEVTGARDLAEKITTLFDNRQALDKLRANAASVLEQMGGAEEKTIEALGEFLSAQTDSVHDGYKDKKAGLKRAS